MSEIQSYEPLAHASLHGTYSLVDLHSGRAYPLQPGRNSIGRSRKSHIQLDDGMVSREHAVVMVYEEGACEIGDANSCNGVFLNGRKVRQPAALTLGDLLEISGNRLIFTRQTADTSTPPVFADEALGVLVWNAPDARWHFGITLGVNRFAAATYIPPSGGSPLSSQDVAQVRDFVRQVKAREHEARLLVEDHSRFIGNHTPVELTHVNITHKTATLIYHGPPDGKGGIVLNQSGDVIFGPVWLSGAINSGS